MRSLLFYIIIRVFAYYCLRTFFFFANKSWLNHVFWVKLCHFLTFLFDTHKVCFLSSSLVCIFVHLNLLLIAIIFSISDVLFLHFYKLYYDLRLKKIPRVIVIYSYQHSCFVFLTVSVLIFSNYKLISILFDIILITYLKLCKIIYL